MTLRATTAVRPPAVAGMFYTGHATALEREVDELLSRARAATVPGTPVALIVPHAGYVYSGATAARAYALLRTKMFETVVIVSPSHREYFNGVSVYNGAAYRTPLGEMTVDADLRDHLLEKETLIEASVRGHGAEHAVEVQLPFLQKTLGDAKILPIVMGDQRREYCYHLGKRLAEVLSGRRVLLVASSDLSHYHPYDEAVSLDTIVIEDLRAFDPDRLMEDLESDRTEACGGGPAVAVLLAARALGADRVEVLYRCNSGDVTGDRDAVVGYVSAAAVRTHPA